MSKYSEMRKKIESYNINKLVSNKEAKIYLLERGYNGRILSFSPYSLNTNTNLYSDNAYKYSGLSRAIHNEIDNPRNIVEKEILKLIPNDFSTFFHLFIKEISSYGKYVNYCNNYNIPLMKKEKYYTLLKLIKKWRILSQKAHYCPTKQQKRKLKKIYKNT